MERRVLVGVVFATLMAAFVTGAYAQCGQITTTCFVYDATCTVKNTDQSPFCRGTNGADCIIGDSPIIGGVQNPNSADREDVINARGGSDIVVSDDRDDVICAGGGNDILSGGDGDDFILAGGGNDIFTGGNDVDEINGQGGNDILFGNDAGDTLIGGPGNDVCIGNDGVDFIACEIAVPH